jgi:hypothetical protein
MSALYSITTRASGTILTAAIYNADHQNHVNFGDAAHLGSFSANATQMQQAVNPGDVGSESLAISIGDELTRIRYIIAKMRGTDYWYRSPNLAVQLGSSNDVGRNLLHNPLFNIQQRGAGPWTATGFMVDRWRLTLSLDTASASVVSASDSARALIGDESCRYLLQNVFTGNAGASAFNEFTHSIEGVRRLAGKTVTLSFYAFSSVAGLKLGINGYQSYGTGGSGTVVIQTTGSSVTLANTFARYSTTLAIPSSAGQTVGTSNDDYTVLQIFFSSGATNNASAGNIGVQSGTVQLWGIQLEIGSVATPLEKPDPQQDLAKCQRFYQVGAFGLQGYNSAGGSNTLYIPYQVPMRASPTFTIANVSPANCTGTTLASVAIGGIIGAHYSFQATTTATGGWASSGTFTASADL